MCFKHFLHISRSSAWSLVWTATLSEPSSLNLFASMFTSHELCHLATSLFCSDNATGNVIMEGDNTYSVISVINLFTEEKLIPLFPSMPCSHEHWDMSRKEPYSLLKSMVKQESRFLGVLLTYKAYMRTLTFPLQTQSCLSKVMLEGTRLSSLLQTRLVIPNDRMTE